MHIAFSSFEFRVAKITPEDTSHPEFMSLGKSFTDLGNLSRRFVGTKIYDGANSNRSEIVCFFNCSEQHLIEHFRQGQQLVVIDLYDERNLVRILPANRT